MFSLVKRMVGPLFDPVYSPCPLQSHLRETRLVRLERGQWDDEIHCRLEVVALGTKPDYEALSYVWGHSCDLQSIFLNGHVAKVGANLASALRLLRHLSKDRILWIDAISVNQSNVQERSYQVTLMRDIYFQCKQVIIWLGHTDEAKPEQGKHASQPDYTAMQNSSTTHADEEKALSRFQAALEVYYKLPFSLRHSVNIDPSTGAYCLIHLLAKNKHVNSAEIPFLTNHDAFHRFVLRLGEIMSSSWWTRQWVIQEVVLPRKATVCFGNLILPWELLASAARNYEYHRTTCCQSHYTYLHWNDIRQLENFSRIVVELDKLREEWQNISAGQAKSVQISLRQLLWQFRERDTLDARDKVYSLLPLVNYWGKQIPMHSDYNWTVQQVYRAAMERIIDIDESLLILMGTMDKILPGLPSWVPDWSKKSPKFELERLERAELFNTSSGRKPEVQFLGETFLKLAGVPFDVVTRTTDIMNYDDEEKTLESFGSWYAFICRDQQITANYPAGGSVMEAYWRTLCMNTTRAIGTEKGLFKAGRRYKKCSQSYVQQSMNSWMDHRGLPSTNCEKLNGFTENSHHEIPNGIKSADAASHCRFTVQTNGAIEDNLDFVAIDFAITSATAMRRLFSTKKGYIGLGPPGMSPGDLVYVLVGGPMPFVIRDVGQRKIPHGEIQSCYQLIGECYLHGIMEGEAMKEYESMKQMIHLL